MYYNITFNKKRIAELNGLKKVTYAEAGKLLGIDREHFDEKNNWYKVNGVLQYFKQRGDARVLGEFLSDAVLHMHGFETASYRLVSMDGATGLLSPNIHRDGYKYESLATLHRLYPQFGNPYYTASTSVTLKKIIELIESVTPNNQELKTQIIRKYVIDWFTHQLDNNIRNLTFEQGPDGKLRLAPIIDSESSFAATKNGIDSKYNKIWVPAIPFDDPEFRTGPMTLDGLDANIISLLWEYPEIVKGILDEIINNNYTPIINEFQKRAGGAVGIESEGIDFLKRFVEAKQEEASKIVR